MKYFTADLHFGHANIIKYDSRPFSSIGDMEDALIEKWNSTVRDSDDVYVLGDFFWYSRAAAERTCVKLNGNIFTLQGNHDSNKLERLHESGYVTHLGPYHELNIRPQENAYGMSAHLVLCHYPIQSWNGRNHGSVHLHGHCHGNLPSMARRLDVGSPVYDYTPISLDRVLEATVIAFPGVDNEGI